MTITPNVNKYRTTNYPRTLAKPAPAGVGWALSAILILASFVAGLIVAIGFVL